MTEKSAAPNAAFAAALRAQGLRRVDVAAAVGVSGKTVKSWLAGRVPYVHNQNLVAALVGVPAVELWPAPCRPEGQHQRFMHAHRKAARLAHRHGPLRLLHAEINARQLVIAAGHPDSVQRRIERIAVLNPGLISEQPDLIEAATYPEAISITVAALNKTS